MKQINRRNMIFYAFAIYFVVLIIAQFFVSSYSAYEVNLGSSLETPNLTHWLGTDDYGRDLFSRVIIGARYTLIISDQSTRLSEIWTINCSYECVNHILHYWAPFASALMAACTTACGKTDTNVHCAPFGLSLASLAQFFMLRCFKDIVLVDVP